MKSFFEKKFLNSLITILVGIFCILLTLNLLGMAGAHTFYLIHEKTTNERVIL